MANPFNTMLPDGSGPVPRPNMTNVRLAQHELAVVNEDAARMAGSALEQRRLEEAHRRHADIVRGEQELAYLRQQSRAAHRAAGDDFQDRIRAQFVASVKAEAERLGLPFQEPVEEMIEAPKPVDLRQGAGPSFDSDLSNIGERHIRAVLSDQR